MSSRNRLSTSSTSKVDHIALALTESYNEQIVPLLTTIDLIRNRIVAVDTTIDLPAIVVIGEQSSGKSSVLEALSGISLPRGGREMTTKCPLELRMRRSSTWYASLECSGRVIRDNIPNPKIVGSIINEEQNRLTHNRDQISKQVLLLNIQAPWLPNLTLIDLPGIIQVTSKQQDSASVNIIEELIQTYLDKPSVIILAIIQACNDIETSAAIKYAKIFDPDGERTIGILTKLDLVDRGTEQKLLEVFENKRISLKHGYLMLKCRTQEDIDNKIELDEALRKEEEFFSNSLHFQSVPIERRGCSSLARFLTNTLVRHIKQTLPHLITELRTKISGVEQQLRHLGIDDYTQLLLTNEPRSRYLTDKLLTAMQLFRKNIHAVEAGAQINNPLYAKRNEFNLQFYDDMHKCKLENEKLSDLIRSTMIATQGPEPSDYILFRVTKTVCLNYIKAIRLPMEQYLRNMLERTNSVLSSVINEVFHMHPNLLAEMRLMHENIERELKDKCNRELELMLEMEQSFTYADNPLYKETLGRIKRIHKQNPNDLLTTTIVQSARIPYTTINSPVNSISTSLKRTNDRMSEDDLDEQLDPPIKTSRLNHSSTSRLSSLWSNLWTTSQKDISESFPSDDNDARASSNYISSSRSATLSAAAHVVNDNLSDEEIIEYKIRILTMQDIICQRIILTFPQRIEYQLVRKQFTKLDLQSSILSSTSLEKLDYLMANNPETERRQNDLINKRKIYEEIIKELQGLDQHQSNANKA